MGRTFKWRQSGGIPATGLSLHGPVEIGEAARRPVPLPKHRLGDDGDDRVRLQTEIDLPYIDLVHVGSGPKRVAVRTSQAGYRVDTYRPEDTTAKCIGFARITTIIYLASGFWLLGLKAPLNRGVIQRRFFRYIPKDWVAARQSISFRGCAKFLISEHSPRVDDAFSRAGENTGCFQFAEQIGDLVRRCSCQHGKLRSCRGTIRNKKVAVWNSIVHYGDQFDPETTCRQTAYSEGRIGLPVGGEKSQPRICHRSVSLIELPLPKVAARLLASS